MSNTPDSKPRNEHRDEILDKVRTVTSMPISPELFEQLYLSPQYKTKAQPRQTFGNPTPIALGGFLLCTTPLSMSLLEWRGAGGFGAAANVGAYFGLGGLMLILGGIGEWILGNTFPSTVFCLFGGFWLTFGTTIVPSSGAYGLYSATEAAADGLEEPQFYATFGFFLVSMTMLSAVFALASIRTNIIFFMIFTLLIPGFSCLSASFFAVAQGASNAVTLQHVGAGLLLAVSLLGWYIFLAVVLQSVDFPFILPVGDLSTLIRGQGDGARKGAAKEV